MAKDRMLHDFRNPGAVGRWEPIDDVVMGGLSSSDLEPTGRGTAVFSGRVSLENNGGFASIRSAPQGWDLGTYAGIALRVRGDGRTYKLNLKTDGGLDGVLYRVSFETVAGEWQTVRFPFAAFEASFRGGPVPDAPPLNPKRIVSMGFLISDRQAGPFRLEIAWLTAYAGTDEAL
jgi:monofunctional biosynthetic peptidoglycan transglycosylase